ncbi:hypothetical protein GH714_001151 [Hevea brasiliensis]|uniref:Uncharacterized protein n=1 Tax=Hevea brasiliensis TaxID=3981 RepID=A0A6A6L5P4_HEVBR|nr:hypothetical protein GH714_001151 [Hevea brasiliensis]
MSPMKIRRELEGNSRFIEEHKQREELRLGRGDDNYHRRSQFGSTSDRSSRDFRMVSNQMNQSSPCENLRGLPYDNRMNENQRWVHGREVNGDAHYSFIERGSNEIGDPSEIRVATGKREHYRCREVNAQLERHSSKGSREDSYEFSRTSRKPLQKKSVLLRIQKPNYRNREDERVHYLGYLDDNKSSSFRGKDQNLYQNHEMGEQVREGSPVELDVSFKSNSLVAKAIATPSSTGVSDLHLTPKNEKVRKVVGLNKDSSSSSAIKPNEGIVKLENAVLVANNASSSDMDLLQSKVEVTASVTGNVQVSGSLPGSSGTKTSPGNSKVESSTKVSVSNKGGTNVISGKTSSLKPHLNETNVVPETENDRVEGFAKVLESDNDTITDSSGLRLPNIKRKRSHSTSPLGSSSHEESKINGNLANGNSANYLHGMSSTDKDFSKLLNENTSSDMDSVEPASKQLCLDGGSFLLENNTASLSPKVLGMETNSAEGNTDFGFLSSEEIKIHEGPASSYNITLGCDSDSGLISDGITVSNIGTTDVSCKEPCTNQGKPLAENGVVDQCLNANFSVGSGKIFCESNSGERTIQNVDTCASCSNEVRTIYSSNSGHIISGEIDFSSNGTIDDVCGRPSSDKVSTLENVPTGGSLNCTISTDGSKENTPNIKKSNKNVEMPQLHVSKSEVNNSYLKPVNMVNSATWVDTTLRLSFKDPTPTEFTVSGDVCGNVGLRGCTDGISDFCLRSSPDALEANASGNSTVNVGPSGISVSAVEVPCNSGNGLMQPEPEMTVSAMNPLFTSDFPPLKKQITEPLDNCSVGGYHGTEDSLIDGFEDSGSEGKQIAEATLVMAGSSHQNNSILIESGEAEKMEVDAGEEQDIADSGTAQCQFPSELQVPDSDERLPGTDVENDSCQHIKNDLPSMSSYLSSLGDGKEVSATNSSGAVMGLVSDTLPDMLSTSHIQLSIEKGGGDDEILLGKRAIKGGSNISVVTSGSPNTEINFNSDHGVENDHSFSGKTGLLPSQDSINSTQMGNTMSGEVYGRKNQPNQAVSRIYPGRSSVPGNKAFSSTVPTQRKLHKQITKFENTSYIRKGNSLVRKPTTMAAQSQSSHGLSSSVYRLNSLGTDEVKKNAGSDIRTGVVDPSNFVRTGANAAFERPRTPPLASATKLPNHASSFLGNLHLPH